VPARSRGAAGVSAALLGTAGYFIHPIAAIADKHEPGPCRQGQVASVVDRPSTGPAPTVSGSPCTVERGKSVVEYGYRNQVDAGPGGSSNLAGYPMTLLRVGVDKHDELVLLPPNMVLRGGYAGESFQPAIGTQDAGLGWKHNFAAHAWFQDALEAFVTAPSGTNGYSYGSPGLALSYVAAFSVGRFSLSPSMSVLDASGTPSAGGAARRFLTYQPSLTVAYGLTPATSLFVNDNVGVPSSPSGGTSNTLLVALQRALSPGTVVDVETDYNLTPQARYRERAVGVGGAFYL